MARCVCVFGDGIYECISFACRTGVPGTSIVVLVFFFRRWFVGLRPVLIALFHRFVRCGPLLTLSTFLFPGFALSLLSGSRADTPVETTVYCNQDKTHPQANFAADFLENGYLKVQSLSDACIRKNLVESYNFVRVCPPLLAMEKLGSELRPRGCL